MPTAAHASRVENANAVIPPRDQVTRMIVEELLARRIENYPAAILRLARQCVLDWLAVTIAGSRDAGPEALFAELQEAGGQAQAQIVGRSARLPILSAALVNGTAAHALDYDDVGFAMSAHPSVVILPALMALAERQGASLEQVIESYVAGYEAASRVGLLLAPSHYDGGFHGTATIGTFAAMACCAHLLRLNAEQTARAFGIAATQAAGIRAMFGTDCKPLHAGKAAQNGLLATLLASRGFGSRPDAIECRVGFADTHSDDFDLATAFSTPASGYFLSDNLFKYHAACYMTHASADGIAQLMEAHALKPDQIGGVRLFVDPGLDTVCNIQNPTSGLEMKFSIRAVGAMTLAGIETSRMDNYDAAVASDQNFRGALERVAVNLRAQPQQTKTDVELDLRDGRHLATSWDAGMPDPDLDRQERRLLGKFMALTRTPLGEQRAAALADRVLRGSLDVPAAELARQTVVSG